MKGYIRKNNAYNLPCLLSDAEDDEDDDEELWSSSIVIYKWCILNKRECNTN